LRVRAMQTTNSALALQSLWALYVSGGFDDALAVRLLKHPSATVRAWVVRFVGDTKRLSRELLQQMISLARTEKNASVRNQLACSAKRWPATAAMPVIHELLRHDEDLADPQIPLLLWWAIENKAISARPEVMGLLSSATDWNLPMMSAHILERLARRYASETDRASRQTCAWLLANAGMTKQRDTVLRGFDKAWEGQPAKPDTSELSAALARVWSPDNLLMVRVGLRLGFPLAQQQAVQQLTNAALPEVERAALAETLGQCEVAPSIPVLITLLRSKPRLQLAAVSALQNFSEPALAAALLESYPRLSPEARTRVRSALASRPGWAQQWVRAIESGNMDAKEVTPELLRQMIRHGDASLNTAIEKRWGRLQTQTAADKASSINRLKLVLNPSGTTLRFKGDVAEGRKLFTSMCATCHKLFGEGSTIGPDLTGADRKNVEWLLGQVVDPSAFIRPEYVNHNVEMKDGRSLTGLIVEQSDSAITLLDAQNQRTVLNRAGLKDLGVSATSLMPEGLLEALAPQQVRDLFSYLQSNP